MVACISVEMPDTQNIVLINSLNARLLLAIHSGADKMMGTANVEPNIVMYCYREKIQPKISVSLFFG